MSTTQRGGSRFALGVKQELEACGAWFFGSRRSLGGEPDMWYWCGGLQVPQSGKRLRIDLMVLFLYVFDLLCNTGECTGRFQNSGSKLGI